MDGNIPGGNFLGGNFPGENFPEGSLTGGNFTFLLWWDSNFDSDMLLRNNSVSDISRFYIKDLLQNSVYCKCIRTNVKCF